MRRAAAVLLAGAVVALLAGPALAAPTGFSQTVISGNDQIVSLDLGGSTAGVTLPNPTGQPANTSTEDQKFSHSGVDFGINEQNSGVCELVTINTTTGVATTVGSTVITTDCGGSSAPRLAFTPDGRLWLVNNGTLLYQVNPATGVATAAGTLPVAVNAVVGTCSGNLLAITQDPNNGSLISFSPANPSAPTTIGQLGIITEDSNFGVVGMDFAADGTLWALRSQAAVGVASYTINPGTGAATQVRADVQAPNLTQGLAIAPLSCPAAPATTVITPLFTG
ncbi:MAG TPA: hypothetical protein VGU73_12755 [Acidimicrobiia bacterium]|nr:hypothetical protein [Acidimicrobiia bacterium]